MRIYAVNNDIVEGAIHGRRFQGYDEWASFLKMLLKHIPIADE